MHHTAVEASPKSLGPVMNVKYRARTNYNIPLSGHGKVQIPFPHKHVPRWLHPLQIVPFPFSPGVTESRGISSRGRKKVPRNGLSHFLLLHVIFRSRDHIIWVYHTKYKVSDNAMASYVLCCCLQLLREQCRRVRNGATPVPFSFKLFVKLER